MSKRAKSTWVVALCTAAVSLGWLRLINGAGASPAWDGLDEAVIGRIVEESGSVGPSFSIEWVRGDLLLFMFLCAGLAAGFVLGYFARSVFGRESTDSAAKSGEP